MSSESSNDETADAEFDRLPMAPARFWAILSGDAATAQEIEHIRSKAQLRQQAHYVLTQRNDPRAGWFVSEDVTPS